MYNIMYLPLRFINGTKVITQSHMSRPTNNNVLTGNEAEHCKCGRLLRVRDAIDILINILINHGINVRYENGVIWNALKLRNILPLFTR